MLHSSNLSKKILLTSIQKALACLFMLMITNPEIIRAQSLIAGWDFQTTTNGGTAVLAAPNTPTVFNANFGSGTIYLNGTNGSSTWLSTASNPQLTGFAGTAVNAGSGFSTVTTSPACMAIANSTANGKSMVFTFSMTGRINLLVSYATQRTTSGFNSQVWDFSTDGVNWTPAQTISSIPSSFGQISLSTINGLDNAATAYLRLTVNGATSSTGNNRLDNIQLVASIAAPPVVANDTAYGQVGAAFSKTVNATNGPTSYTASGMEAWMNFDTNTGIFTGTPTQVDTFDVVVDAFNAFGSGTGTTTVIITQGSQTINFPALNPVTYGDPAFNLNATGGASGNPVTYVSSNTSVATISGNTVTIVGAGTTQITASQAGNTNYAQATDVQQNLVVNQAAQAITFGSLPNKLTTDPPFALNATGGGSGNPITYVSSNTSVASIVGNIVTINGAGTTQITASQVGDANYLAAPDVTQNLVVTNPSLLPQTITFNPLSAVTYGDAPFNLTATGGGSGNPVTYTSSNPTVASVIGNTVTIHAPGTTTITASQAGNVSYQPALDVSQNLLVNPKNLTVPGAVAFNKVYDGTTVATLFNLTLSGVVGADVVSATGNGTFADPNVGNAIPVTANLQLTGADNFKYTLTQPTGLVADITKASQTITFGPISAKTFGNAPFTLSATGGGSTSPVTFSSDNPLVATISGNLVTIVGAGTANITASQAGDTNHFAATDVVQVLLVNKANQTITFALQPSRVLGSGSFILSATANSGLPVSFSSSNTSVATVTDSTVTPLSVGNTIITASQAGNTNYNAANSINRDIVITYPLIAAWDFTGQSSPATSAATLFNANLDTLSNANLLTRGPGANANTAGNSFRSTGFQNNGIATTNTDYFQATLQAKPGYSLSLSSINGVFAGTASFAATPGVSAQYAYSLDGVNFTLIGSPYQTIGTPAYSPLIDVTGVPDLQNVHTSKKVTIRYYASGQTTTGGWGFNSPLPGIYGLSFGGNTNICVPQNNTTNLTICANQLPYTWGSQTITMAGTYTQTGINQAGCDSNETLVLTVDPCPSNTTLQLTCFIQGYYAGSATMAPVLANQGETSTTTACDTIDIELRDEFNPATIVGFSRVILNQDGTASATFPSLSGNHYIVVKHRSAIQTWSANPVSFSNPVVSYNFSDAATKAYGSNMTEMSPGVWAFYSGDVIADENMDLLDLGLVETDINNFAFGYQTTDINGDGNVDLLDSAPVEANVNAFIFSNHP